LVLLIGMSFDPHIKRVYLSGRVSMMIGSNALRALAVSFFVLLLSACSDGGGTTRSPDASGAVFAGVTPTTRTVEPSSDSDLADAAAVKRRILEDGSVSDSEMEQALLAVIGCVRRSGYGAELESFEAAAGHTFSISASTEDGIGAAESEAERCSDIYLTDVESVYSLEHGPSQEEIEAGMRETIACLVSRGFAVDGLTTAEASQVVPALDMVECDAVS